VQLTFDSDVEEFRAEFSAFLDDHLPSEAQTQERPRVGVTHAAVGPRLATAAVRQRLATARTARRNSAAANADRCCSSSYTSTNCVVAASTTASTRRV